MCDYCGEPTWMFEGGPMDPSTLPISDVLVQCLNAWFDVFNHGSAFEPWEDGQFEEWCKIGKTLAITLREELPSEWTVVYFDPMKTTEDVDQDRSEFEYEITL